MKMTRTVTVLALVVVLVLSMTGCRRVRLDDGRGRSSVEGSSVVDPTVPVPLGDAEAVDAEIEMAAGELAVAGGAADDAALEGEFDVEPWKWRPRIRYAVTDARGQLSVKQPPLEFGMGDTRNSWDLRLPSEVPLKLDLELGAGQSGLDLTGMRLEKLDVRLGAGEATIDLSGEWENDLDARIEAGVGRLELIVPEGVGVRLTGDREGIGEFTAEGFSRDGSDLVNDAWATAEHKLEIELRQGVGEIRVEMVR